MKYRVVVAVRTEGAIGAFYPKVYLVTSNHETYDPEFREDVLDCVSRSGYEPSHILNISEYRED